MKKIKVNLGDRSYDILTGAGAAAELPRVVKGLFFAGPIVVITDKAVMKKTARITAPVFRQLPNEVLRVVVPQSERAKSLKVFQNTVYEISSRTRTHCPLIVAVGGGVVGDLAGFIAATYRRGVPLVQIPTTLLAQVDSAIGGKTAIDLPEAKNLVGAFYQPRAVLMDPKFLKSLPRSQVRNGMAEVIKYAVIGNRRFFDFLENNIGEIMSLKTDRIERVVYECAAIKARIVERDERDTKGIRIALNFGHTLGHAVEAASGYSGRYSHGEAVAIGMILAGEIAVRLDMFSETDLERMKNLIRKVGFPARIRGVSVKDIMNSYGYDKKFMSGVNRFVLPRKIGSVEIIEDIPVLLLRTVLRKYTE